MPPAPCRALDSLGGCRDTCPDLIRASGWARTLCRGFPSSSCPRSALAFLFKVPVSRYMSWQFQNTPNSVKHVEKSIKL